MSAVNLVTPPKHTSSPGGLPPKQTGVPGDNPEVVITNCNLFIYPDGGELVGWEERVIFGPRLVHDGEGSKRSKTAEEQEKEHARRAACMLRRRVRNAGLTKMWTLTFPGRGIHDYEVAARLFSRWMNDYGNRLFHGYYVAVPELHPLGHGWHWHVVTKPYIPVDKVRRSWTRFLARRGMRPSGGAKFVRVHVKRFGSSRRAASYVAKYITKTVGQGIPKGCKRYRYGANTTLPKPVRQFIIPFQLDKALVEAIAEVKAIGVEDYYVWFWDPLEDPWPVFIISW